MLKLLKFSVVICLLFLWINAYWASSDFAITKADPIYSKKIDLTFNSNLESSSSAVRDFKIVNKGDDLDVINITTNKLISSDTLEIELDKDLSVSTEYEINVISIKDDKWNSITKGINWIVAFKTPSEFPIESTLTGSWSDMSWTTNTGTVQDLTTPTVEKKEEILMSSASKEEYSTWVSNTVVAESKNNENLPKTWPEEILLILWSLILWLFILKKKKA